MPKYTLRVAFRPSPVEEKAVTENLFIPGTPPFSRHCSACPGCGSLKDCTSVSLRVTSILVSALRALPVASLVGATKLRLTSLAPLGARVSCRFVTESGAAVCAPAVTSMSSMPR